MEILKDKYLWLFVAALGALIFGLALFSDISYILLAFGALIAISFLLAFRHPFAGLLALLIIRPLLDVTSGDTLFAIAGLDINPAGIFGLLAIVWAAWLAWQKRHQLSRIHRLGWLWVLFLGSAALSCLYSFSLGSSLEELSRLLSIFALFLAASLLVDSASKLTRLIKSILFSAVVPSLVALWQLFSGTGLLENGTNRLLATFGHPNMFAFFLVFVLSLSVFAALNLDYRKVQPYLYYLASLAMLILLFFTYTRGAYVALAIFILIVGVMRFRKFLVAGLLVVSLVVLAYSPIRERAISIFSFRADDSISWRLGLWQEGWEYAQPKIASGYGLGTAPQVIAAHKPYYHGSVEPHNDYLRILLEQGVPGVFAYLLLIAGLIYALLHRYLGQQRPKLKVFNLFAIAAAISLFAMSFGDNILNDTALQLAFWSLVGAVLSFQVRKKRLIS